MKGFYSIFFVLFVTLPFLLIGQKETFKVMTYNLMYYKTSDAPCTPGISFAEKDESFKTVFDAVVPDILCVNEIASYSDNSAARSVLNNVINKSGRDSYVSADFSSSNISSIANMMFYDSSKFVLKSQTYIDRDINNAPLVRLIDFYRLYYKDPGLSTGNIDTVFLTVVAAHLKAGTSASDRSDREAASEAVMEYLAEEVPDDNVMLCGDLNVYGHTEGAYRALTDNPSAGNEQLNDPINRGGAWNNNSIFAQYHTQSTHSSPSGCYSGGGMDDRFDFILASNAVMNGSSGIQYKTDTYQAFGQDGNHFNSSVNFNNTAVSQEIADALYTFSDHLPVVAEFEVESSSVSLGEEKWVTSVKYANPIGGQLDLYRRGAALEKELDVKIYSLTGKRVYETQWQERVNNLEIISISWPRGIYLLEMKDRETGEGYTKKLIRK